MKDAPKGYTFPIRDIRASVGSVRAGILPGGGTIVEAEEGLRTSHLIDISIGRTVTAVDLVIISNETEGYTFHWPITGDANSNCSVNVLDLIYIRNQLGKDIISGDLWRADINNDGRINVLDLIATRNKLGTKCP